jgi:ketosteroid isomerase-like protein
MSQDNVAVALALIDAWNEGSVEGIAPLMAEGIVWLEVEGRPETQGTEIRGRDAVGSGMESLFESWEDYRLEPEEVREVDGDRVVAVLREVARGRASGVEVTSRWGYVMTVRDGKLARVEAYRDPDEALKSVGAA